MDKEPKIIGVGGVFFKCKNPEKTRKWYGEQFGLATNDYGILFQTRSAIDSNKKQYLQWSTFSKKSTYMEGDFMINYRVQNIEGLIKKLRDSGVTILDEIETYDYGKFVHVLDPEGNKLELWEPIDEVFTAQYEHDANY
ncbi:MAG: VOC family protein [Cyclobacteriaceae bacterium]